MKIKIYVYESEGKVYADSYTELEEITTDYSGAELAEYQLLESTIEQKAAEMLEGYTDFKLILLQNIDVLDSAVEYLHCSIKNGQCNSAYSEFKNQINKIVREDAIRDLTEDLTNMVLKEHR